MSEGTVIISIARFLELAEAEKKLSEKKHNITIREARGYGGHIETIRTDDEAVRKLAEELAEKNKELDQWSESRVKMIDSEKRKAITEAEERFKKMSFLSLWKWYRNNKLSLVK